MNRSVSGPGPKFARRLSHTVRSWLSQLGGSRGPKVDSAQYWEQRYRAGQTSGTGSYGRLARFKAEFLNAFVAKHDIRSVIEFGSGDGAQLELAEYLSYLGVDVSETAVRECREKFAARANYSFCTLDQFDLSTKADLTLSLDVIYHLVEDRVFEDYMRRLFDSSAGFVIVYSSNSEDPVAARHVRRRRFTDWVERNRPDFSLLETVPNKYPFDPADPDNTSRADFFVYQAVGSAA